MSKQVSSTSAQSPTSRRISSDSALVLSPPAQEIARAINASRDLPDLDPFFLSEFQPPHPWAGLSVAEVVASLSSTSARLINLISTAPDFRYYLSDFGKGVGLYSCAVPNVADFHRERDELALVFRQDENPFAEQFLERLKSCVSNQHKFPLISSFIRDWVYTRRVQRDNPALLQEKQRLAFFPIAALLNILSQKCSGVATLLSFYLSTNGLSESGVSVMAVTIFFFSQLAPSSSLLAENGECRFDENHAF